MMCAFIPNRKCVISARPCKECLNDYSKRMCDYIEGRECIVANEPCDVCCQTYREELNEKRKAVEWYKEYYTNKKEDVNMEKKGVNNNEKEVKLLASCNHCHKNFTLVVKYGDYIKWVEGAHVQHVFPYLSADKRELLINQTCGECWDEMFPEFDCEDCADEGCPKCDESYFINTDDISDEELEETFRKLFEEE